MYAWRATVKFGDEEIRTYMVLADSHADRKAVSEKVTNDAMKALTVVVLDDVQAFEPDEFDEIIKVLP